MSTIETGTTKRGCVSRNFVKTSKGDGSFPFSEKVEQGGYTNTKDKEYPQRKNTHIFVDVFFHTETRFHIVTNYGDNEDTT